MDLYTRIMFLDMDGPVFNERTNAFGDLTPECYTSDMNNIYSIPDQTVLRVLNAIGRVVDFAVVITSTAWPKDVAESALRKGGFKGKFHTDAIGNIESNNRSQRIDEFLDAHPEITHYCWVDDTWGCAREHQLPYLVPVSVSEGLDTIGLNQMYDLMTNGKVSYEAENRPEIFDEIFPNNTVVKQLRLYRERNFALTKHFFRKKRFEYSGRPGPREPTINQLVRLRRLAPN